MIRVEAKSRGKANLHKRFPRATINNKGGDRKAFKVVTSCWGYKDYYDHKQVYRFLRANVGRPMNNVLHDFIGKCGKSVTDYSPREILYKYIQEKEDIDWWGGFYITNGILNYKPRKKRPYRYIPTRLTSTYCDENSKQFSSVTPSKVLEEIEHKGKAYIGKYYAKSHPYRGNADYIDIYVMKTEDYFTPKTDAHYYVSRMYVTFSYNIVGFNIVDGVMVLKATWEGEAPTYMFVTKAKYNKKLSDV